MITLYHDWDAFCCIKVRFCLIEKRADWESRIVNLQQMEQLTPDYLAVNPNGVVPTLVHDGRVIFESTIINEYLNEVLPGPDLLPQDPAARAAARYWVKFEDDVLHPSVRGPTYQLMLRQSFARLPKALVEDRITHAPTPQKAEFLRKALTDGPADAEAVTAARAAFIRAIDRMEERLAGHEWFGGADFSLADIAISPFVDRLEELNFAGLWDDKPALAGWIGRIKARPAYQAAIPKSHQRIPAPLAASTR
jgi:glutathione S-transferase